MQIKEGANLQGLHFMTRPMMVQADEVWKNHGQELVVTSGLEGTHSAGSLHYCGRALDFRTRFWEREEQEEVYKELRARLSTKAFDVILHKTHIHVEYDPK